MTVTQASGIDDVMNRVIARAPSARAVVTQIVSSREQQQRASREIERGIQRLATLGVTQRDIAALVGLSQPEVSRRLKREQLSTDIQRLHRIVERREAGELTSAQLVKALGSAVKPRRNPSRISAYDDSSTSSRSVAEVARLYKSGAITRDEYSAVRALLAGRQRSR